jgi:hypothetical protein
MAWQARDVAEKTVIKFVNVVIARRPRKDRRRLLPGIGS